MIRFSDIESRARAATIELRKRTLLSGEPFMVYDRDLPAGYYYMEYPEGDIKIVVANREINDFVVEQDLTTEQVQELRRKFELTPVFPSFS